MIGQATAHRRANAFAQALEDAAVPGETAGEHDTGDPGAPPAPAPAEAPPAAGGTPPGSQGDPSGSRAGGQQPGANGTQGAHGVHAAARHADPEQAAMLALAAALSNRPRPVMDAEKKTVQRAQLVAAMEQALADGSFATGRVPEQRSGSREAQRPAGLRRLGPRSKLSRRIAAGSLTVGVAAGAFGGVAAASSNALPGDTLYGLKRSMEDLKLDLAGGNASRGKVYLDMASTRMQEARRLMERGRGGPLDAESLAEVRKALSGMHQEASEGHRLLSRAYQQDGSLQPIELLNSFAQSNRRGWTDLRGRLPSQLTDVSDKVNSVFDAIDQEVAPLKPLLPKPKDHGSPSAPGTAGSTAPGTDGSRGAPVGTTPSGGRSTPPASGGPGHQSPGSPSPSPSTTPPGLIGGSGNLFGPPPTTPPSTPGTSPTTTPPPGHSVILPPLLPGLLPGLGLTEDNPGQ